MPETGRFNIHRIWLGGKMPERYVEYGHMWEELNPFYVLHDWTEEEIWDSEWINEEVIQDLYRKSRMDDADQIAYYTQVADVLDYELIYKYGGWYFNADMKPVRSLADLPHFDPTLPGFAMEDNVHPVNMAMYGLPYEMLFKVIIGSLPERYFSMPNAFMNATTGVQLIQQVTQSWPAPVQYWHRDVFNPVHWSKIKLGEEFAEPKDLPQDTVAVHEWLHRTNKRAQRVVDYD